MQALEAYERQDIKVVVGGEFLFDPIKKIMLY